MNYSHIALLSDIHFGSHSNNQEWLLNTVEYFNNFFIPLVKKTKKEHPDLLIAVLGDIFENRSTLNIKVWNEALKIFEELSQITDIKIIVGNHDLVQKNSTDITSVSTLKYIPNIQIYLQPETLKLKNGKSILFLPWLSEDFNKEKELLESSKADYLFCHTTFQNVFQNKYIQTHEGLEIEKISKNFKQIYSGHIHHNQKIKNIRYIGCPYPLSRSDMDNEKYICILNTETGHEDIIINEYSPRFIKLYLDDILDMTVEEYKYKVENNFVDIVSDIKWSTIFPFNRLLELSDKYRKININVSSETSFELEYEHNLGNDYDNFNLLQLSDEYIKQTPYQENVKDIVRTKIIDLYQKVSSEA